MRVLTVGSMYPPDHLGGYELVWRGAVGHLRARGHAVEVLTTLPRAATAGDGAHRVLRWYWRDHEILRPGLRETVRLERHNQRALARLLATHRPDVVAWFGMGAMSLSLLEAVRRAGLPSVAFVHDDWLAYAPRVDAWTRRARRAPRVAEALAGVPVARDPAAGARLVFVSASTRERARRAGVGSADAEVAHSGVDAAFLHAAPDRPWGWRLLCVGRVDPRKGLSTAIEALSLLPPEATLTVAGDGDPRERARLGALAARLGLADRVAFAGAVSGEARPAVYADADAVLFPVTWEEPWGLVPLEAMGVGRPVVATGLGGSGEYLVDEGNALLHPPGDAAALAAAVRRLARDPALRARLREEGLSTAAAHTAAAFEARVEQALLAAVRP